VSETEIDQRGPDMGQPICGARNPIER